MLQGYLLSYWGMDSVSPTHDSQWIMNSSAQTWKWEDCVKNLHESTYVTIESPVVIFKLAYKNICWAFDMKGFQKQVGLFFLVDPWKNVTVVSPILRKSESMTWLLTHLIRNRPSRISWHRQQNISIQVLFWRLSLSIFTTVQLREAFPTKLLERLLLKQI